MKSTAYISLLAAISIAIISIFLSAASFAGEYDAVYSEYPKNRFIIGIGETQKSNNQLVDKRKAEVFARREIATQIRVSVTSETMDILCGGGDKKTKIHKSAETCREEFVDIITSTVDETLEGSKIVKYGEHDGIYYAVVVMERSAAAKAAGDNLNEAIDKTKENIDKAKKGDEKAKDEAKEQYMKARVLDKEKEVFEGVKGRADKMFDELETEILKLEGGAK